MGAGLRSQWSNWEQTELGAMLMGAFCLGGVRGGADMGGRHRTDATTLQGDVT